MHGTRLFSAINLRKFFFMNLFKLDQENPSRFDSSSFFVFYIFNWIIIVSYTFHFMLLLFLSGCCRIDLQMLDTELSKPLQFVLRLKWKLAGREILAVLEVNQIKSFQEQRFSLFYSWFSFSTAQTLEIMWSRKCTSMLL